MSDKEWQIAIFGTFDVENYGDLLFPIIAEAELSKRLGPVKLHRFSYHPKSQPNWPYTVTSLTELPEIACNLDGILIGGGFIIRFDKEVASNYRPPTTNIHHPTGYWLTPALIALQQGIPLAWNAPGMHCNDIPTWAHPLIRLVLENSSYVAVRDEPSQVALANFVEKSKIEILPDTAFGISQLSDDQKLSSEYISLTKSSGITMPYIVVQAANCLDPFLNLVKTHAHLFFDYKFLVLPMGPVLGDHEAILHNKLPGALCLSHWPHPQLIVELIRHAEAVIGHSYHLAITALAFGVPVFSSADLSTGKYTALSDFKTIYPVHDLMDPHLFISRLGKKEPCSAARTAIVQLTYHWDRIAQALRGTSSNTQSAISRFLQSLPNLLEAAPNYTEELANNQITIQQENDHLNRALALLHRSHSIEIETASGRINKLENNLIVINQKNDELNKSVARLHSSNSMKITAPLRFLVRTLGYLLRKR